MKYIPGEISKSQTSTCAHVLLRLIAIKVAYKRHCVWREQHELAGGAKLISYSYFSQLFSFRDMAATINELSLHRIHITSNIYELYSVY